MFDSKEHSHRRLNILTGEWVQVSPHRSKRPWQGQVEKLEQERRPEHDPTCYLCAGNERIGGERNPDYKDIFVFTNDFASLQGDIPSGGDNNGLLQSKSERGLCKVICFSPRHDLTIPEMDIDGIEKVVDLWIKQCEEIGALDYINHIQIFENKGAVMGCSNPHPHGQIWAQESIPVEPMKKQFQQEKYRLDHGRDLLADYLQQELAAKERILFENEHMVVLIPYWAVWPFEAMILPKRQMPNITDMTIEEKRAFAEAYQHLTIKYDNLFQTSFPYSAGIHQAPCDGRKHPEWHWHMSFYPPLLRSATVKKFMVGYEMFANPQRDITAESAAQRLRELPDLHYLNIGK
ncbi:UDP-glucose--hexose-1-phosphate uridylyltransferase [Reichenbachiella agarivorans]|uniref:Galactose-1-phosphate uridylyltransferase n=1 Tax=Reichenbachiella agarivorans TaxID=2979464 RepID=A0ABY6CMI6_9BACT|nr:UDP-glucose--hexose-1-phosphate uridylyltransferase [Reichenbachiella agarivorans]UXP30698.1 UDP-glucose--hexose-1-phosphate uridylyltransferase [Reichenbachiella agarivorans]